VVVPPSHGAGPHNIYRVKTEIKERNHIFERKKETRFIRRFYKFTFIIYDDKNIFLSNLIFSINYGEKL
jgi:hypothetical protein